MVQCQVMTGATNNNEEQRDGRVGWATCDRIIFREGFAK